MDMLDRLAIATKLMSGLLANPTVVGDSTRYGWKLTNCTEEDLAEYSLLLADTLLDCNKKCGEEVQDG